MDKALERAIRKRMEECLDRIDVQQLKRSLEEEQAIAVIDLIATCRQYISSERG